MSGFGAGIRRGVMAADQFTQIANGLFRDGRLTYKAKGIFGYISTHRSGWRVTIADLVRLGPDGREAVRTGLKELEEHGYLIRERLRRPGGTLGESVYCITDHPAVLEPAPPPGDDSTITVTETGPSRRAGAGIRRGVMAGDQFTQISNALFRDGRLSFKAKGIFGYISTHRDGWQVTVAELVRRGREGVDAVATGLKQLEQHGFLHRTRERNPNGTLGQALYVITDLPAPQNTRSQPESGFPRLDEPTLADPGTKNTSRKKTNKQKTRPLRPCARATGSRGSSRTDRSQAAAPAAVSSPTAPSTSDASSAVPPVPTADEMHPGNRLLLEIGAAHPELLLTGKALTDQGRVVTVMLETGWTSAQLRHVIAGRPLPTPVRTSVGAIIAARLRAAQAYPPPATLTGSAHSGDVLDDEPPATAATPERSSTAPAARTVTEALTYRALVECAGCGVPATAPGEDLCPACLDWPLCATCPGPTPRRAHPHGDGRCTTCATTFTGPTEESTP
ncbi:hypothetical protein GCM10010095_71660 [Streptomyces anthocyanicus]|uniref:Helix-turn-helix domain-containing protein n=1 Tax=Streptomyces violaceolatus TaxID=67378 RepID=A0ABN3TGC6_9ACTN|nr:hypothetical protein [Streptomyces anthocyanicus]MBQ0953815.1 hypothetical protein [Streptomyces sp. RK76]GGL76237.1 hypothetical protein GCM10010095_71660 [Streptomyces anthocyanicus]GHC33190.1 hypothetical protein GCM10010348_70140 [Streptomyces anthocyanicus]